jgi:hypothetical protein
MSRPKPTTDYADTRFGFLSPRGSFYKCQYWGHFELAKKLARSWRLGSLADPEPDGFQARCFTPDDWLLRHGWLRLSKGEWLGFELLTQRQIDAVWDWCQANSVSFPPKHIDEDEGGYR